MSAFQLPQQLPSIVLPHCTLLPHGLLPLYIFEDRYKNMLRHALRHDRMFCVAMQDSDGVIAPVATAGMVRACVHNPDGTSHLLLQGMRRVRFTRWYGDHAFPFADVDWPQTRVDSPGFCREAASVMVRQACTLAETHGTLCQQLRDHLRTLEDPEPIVDIVAYNLFRCPSLLQRILECDVLDLRIGMVKDELEKLSA